MLNALLASLVLGLVTYRVSRFIILDTLLEHTRDRVHTWLMIRDGIVWRKAQELLSCPFCVSIWVAAGAVALTDLVDDVRLPVWSWLGASTVAVLVWAQVDTED